jgi:hypothetical protein
MASQFSLAKCQLGTSAFDVLLQIFPAIPRQYNSYPRKIGNKFK